MDLAFDASLIEGYHGKTQMARVLSENWVARHMYCPVCGNPVLIKYAANKPVADFYCDACGNDFELKSQRKDRGPLGRRINDGQYDMMISRITSYRNPNFLFLQYSENKVRNLVLIPNHYFVPDLIIKRKPLPATARRAGWTGCYINIDPIPESGKIFVIREGEVLSKELVMREYQLTAFLKEGDLNGRRWLSDVLSCIERIPSQQFSLEQMYAFVPELQAKHPENNNVHAKVRQQLQFLRDRGYIAFTSRGQYCKIQ
ncbi:MAG: restriction endonuclease [Bacteroidales bacterium]|nr:restriction endonuclease [Bacteroidales bacterium]